MFVVRDWIELDEFGLGLANGKYYIEQESKRVSVNLIVVVTYFYRCWKHEIHVVQCTCYIYLSVFTFNSIHSIHQLTTE